MDRIPINRRSNRPTTTTTNNLQTSFYYSCIPMMMSALLLLVPTYTTALSISPSTTLKTKSGLPIARYGLGGAARSTQPSTLPSLYVEKLLLSSSTKDDRNNNNVLQGAPFLFFYNPHRYPEFMSGVKQICSSETTTDRSDLFLASGSTDRSIDKLEQRLEDCLEYSGGSYLDCFVLEYITPEELMVDVKGDFHPDPIMRLMVHPDVSKAISHIQDNWMKSGKVRYLAISTHSHVVGAVMARNENVDALMIRYNLSHKEAAEEVTFPAALANNKPVIAFTTTRWNTLQEDWSEGALSTADCVSFALGNRAVEGVLHSARDEAELEEVMDGLKLGLGEDEDIWRRYGEGMEATNDDFFDEYPEERYLKARVVMDD